jgi:hypothetical protein
MTLSPAYSLRIGDVSSLNTQNECIDGVLLKINNQKELCSPIYKKCDDFNQELYSFEKQSVCNCCNDMNGFLNQTQCLPESFCSLSKSAGMSCDIDI